MDNGIKAGTTQPRQPAKGKDAGAVDNPVRLATGLLPDDLERDGELHVMVQFCCHLVSTGGLDVLDVQLAPIKRDVGLRLDRGRHIGSGDRAEQTTSAPDFTAMVMVVATSLDATA